MVSVLVTLIILVAIFAIVYWLITSIPLPEPLRIAVIAIAAIVAILLLVSLLPVGAGLRWPGR